LIARHTGRFLFSLLQKIADSMLNWIQLTSEDQLDGLINDPSKPVFALFKHSTRCSISAMVKNRLERSWDEQIQPPVYLIDLLKYRSISNFIAERFAVQHESPQLLIIQNKECVKHWSHTEISTDLVTGF